jgi:hypothetical protein
MRRLIALAVAALALLALSSCTDDNGGAIDAPAFTTTTLAGGGAVLTYYVTMDGASENPAGDPDGRGTGTITIDTAKGEACLELATENLSNIAGVHIHTGVADKNGPIIVPFPTPTEPAGAVCAPLDPANAQAIESDPDGHYLNVHTVEHPDGAIRGQLG